MATTAVEIRGARATLINELRTNWTTAESRAGGPNAEDKANFDRGMDEADAMLECAKRAEQSAMRVGNPDGYEGRASTPFDVETRGRPNGRASSSSQMEAFRHFLKTGEVRQELRSQQSRASDLADRELRDTIISTDAKGGYLVTPTQVSSDILSLIQDRVFIRQLCQTAGSVTTVTEAKKLGVRKLITHASDADWTTEVAAVTEDTTMAFGRRDLEPFLCSKLAKASIRTLMLSAQAETEITNELGYKFGITEEKAFLTGDGSGKPLGVYVPDANGISTARDVTAASATTFTGDNLIDMKFSLKAGYQTDKSTAWVISRAFVKAVRKLKVASTTGGNDLEYLWQPGLTEGEPDRILSIPYYMSEYAPATFTTGLYAAVLGCFRYYRIVQIADVMIQRLVELYAATNEVGFIGRRWVDGAPVMEEAFARLKMA